MAISGRIVGTWVGLIVVVTLVISVMALPNLFPQTELFRWLGYVFVLLVFPIVVILAVRLSKKRDGQ